MKIYYLGTCSGTEPMLNMHHTSYVFEVNGYLYWFDAGENASHTAYTMGMDITSSRALFVTHSHIDHIGGLPNLLFCFGKLNARYGKTLKYNNTLELYLPDAELSSSVKLIAFGKNQSSAPARFTLREHTVSDGVIYEDENVRVSAVHNMHLGEKDSTGWHSFSYLFEAEGKKVVCSGDIKGYFELDELVSHGCDLLIAETGHHAVVDVLRYASENEVKSLRFIHHGREILGDMKKAEKTVSDYSRESGLDAKICYDGMVEEI